MMKNNNMFSTCYSKILKLFSKILVVFINFFTFFIILVFSTRLVATANQSLFSLGYFFGVVIFLCLYFVPIFVYLYYSYSFFFKLEYWLKRFLHSMREVFFLSLFLFIFIIIFFEYSNSIAYIFKDFPVLNENFKNIFTHSIFSSDSALMQFYHDYIGTYLVYLHRIAYEFYSDEIAPRLEYIFNPKRKAAFDRTHAAIKEHMIDVYSNYEPKIRDYDVGKLYDLVRKFHLSTHPVSGDCPLLTCHSLWRIIEIDSAPLYPIEKTHVYFGSKTHKEVCDYCGIKVAEDFLALSSLPETANVDVHGWRFSDAFFINESLHVFYNDLSLYLKDEHGISNYHYKDMLKIEAKYLRADGTLSIFENVVNVYKDIVGSENKLDEFENPRDFCYMLMSKYSPYYLVNYGAKDHYGFTCIVHWLFFDNDEKFVERLDKESTFAVHDYLLMRRILEIQDFKSLDWGYSIMTEIKYLDITSSGPYSPLRIQLINRVVASFVEYYKTVREVLENFFKK